MHQEIKKNLLRASVALRFGLMWHRQKAWTGRVLLSELIVSRMAFGFSPAGEGMLTAPKVKNNVEGSSRSVVSPPEAFVFDSSSRASNVAPAKRRTYVSSQS